MKTIGILIMLCLVVVGLSYALKPSKTKLATYSETLGAGSSDTATIVNVVLDADSVGFQLEVNQDSVSGEIRYSYVTLSGYTDGTAFASLPVLATFSIGEKGVFTYSIPITAGVDMVTMYIITTNQKSAVQTITNTIYSVKWR